MVVVGWGIFYFDDFGRMTTFFAAFAGNAPELHDFTVESALFGNFWLWLSGVVFSLPVYDFVSRHFARLFPHNTLLRRNLVLATRLVVSCVLLFLSVSLLVGATNNAFIYTRF